MRLSFKTLLQLTALLVLATVACRSVAGDHDAVLDWSGLHIVSFPLDGGVTSVHVRAGDRVARGDKLVELNTEPIEIRIDQYEAELAARKPVLADAKRDFEHAKSLYEQTVLSDVELQQAQHTYEQATAELAASRARLKYVYWQKRQASLVAPFDARVVAREVEPGQMLVAEQRSRPLLLLAKVGYMAARATLPLAVVQTLETGQPATVVIDDRSYPARLSSLGMKPESGADAGYQVEAEFEVDPKADYMAGQAATLRLR
ncbi:MAG: efflux RND transporter periplasmic adaptor subunit [Thiotrichales bacterium]|nr:MAG: efflux RND transporter periplasmic adaptor subunit [Thiotrichales bacterium]